MLYFLLVVNIKIITGKGAAIPREYYIRGKDIERRGSAKQLGFSHLHKG